MLLIRNSISNTNKFFKKTLHNIMSFFSPRYQKLPKAPTPPNIQDLDKFYSDFTKQWDSKNDQNTKRRRRSKKKPLVVLSSDEAKHEKEISFTGMNNTSTSNKFNDEEMEKKEENAGDENNKKRSFLSSHQIHQKGKQLLLMINNSKGNGGMVEKKLREMEMLDMSNVDYVLDIEEVLHYYSRLTCPSYLEIVDKFFMEIYSEFFGDPEFSRLKNLRSSVKS